LAVEGLKDPESQVQSFPHVGDNDLTEIESEACPGARGLRLPSSGPGGRSTPRRFQLSPSRTVALLQPLQKRSDINKIKIKDSND
jgi:hypothetical protein